MRRIVSLTFLLFLLAPGPAFAADVSIQPQTCAGAAQFVQDGTAWKIVTPCATTTLSAAEVDQFHALIHPPPPKACGNGLDDDADGLIDLNDPGCTGTDDDDESNAIVAAPQRMANFDNASVCEFDPSCSFSIIGNTTMTYDSADRYGSTGRSVAVSKTGTSTSNDLARIFLYADRAGRCNGSYGAPGEEVSYGGAFKILNPADLSYVRIAGLWERDCPTGQNLTGGIHHVLVIDGRFVVRAEHYPAPAGENIPDLLSADATQCANRWCMVEVTTKMAEDNTGWVELYVNGILQGARKTGVRTQYSPTHKYGNYQGGAGAGFTSISTGNGVFLRFDRQYVGSARVGP